MPELLAAVVALVREHRRCEISTPARTVNVGLKGKWGGAPRCWPCIVVALLCLLTAVTSASAESVWILWSQEVATEPGLVTEDRKAWHRMAAFDSKSACFAYASTKAEELAYGGDQERKIEVLRLGLGGDHLAVKSTFSGGLFDGARMWTYYRCLPDTVEPRGLKTK